MQEINISKLIIEEYTFKLIDSLKNDVVIIGAGPAGLTAGYYLAKYGIKTSIIEKKLSTGGGIWGGAAGYSVIAIEDKEIIEELGIKVKKVNELYVVDAIEFATGLTFKSIQSGVKVFNLIEFDDIIFKNKIIEGIVVNNTTINMANLPVDPYCIQAKCIIDSTGHPAEVIAVLKKKVKDLSINELGEGPMDVIKSEREVVEKTGEVYPGVYVTGMSVCSVYNLPRMGPIFGGMLKSGKKVAELIKKKLD